MLERVRRSPLPLGLPAGSWKDKLWPDGWTAVTEDGKRSAQFEHQVLVTKDGVEILTARQETSPKLWWELDE